MKIVKQNLRDLGGELKNQVKILATVVITFWVVFILNEAILEKILVIGTGCGRSPGLNALGIVPHSFIGLRGILFAPFLHGSFYHIISNTVPFIILGWLGGLGTWVIGRNCSIHIGASGVIFGYLGYLLFRGYFEKSFVAIAISVGIFMTYGGLIWGVLPTNPYISWEGHLFGFIGGIMAAKLLSPSKKAT